MAKIQKGYRIHGQEFLTFFSHLLLDNRYHIWEGWFQLAFVNIAHIQFSTLDEMAK